MRASSRSGVRENDRLCKESPNSGTRINAYKRNTQLKATHRSLEEEEEDNDSLQPKGGQKTSTRTVTQLRQKISWLEHARKKDKQTIHELRRREARRDASDLLDTNEGGDIQNSERMKLLLRKFIQLVEKPSLSEGEECNVCIEEIKMVDARSLPCSHILCNNCLQRLNPWTCPYCRQHFELAAVEEVEYTATEQWDELLEVAKQAAPLVGMDDISVADSDEQSFLNDEEDSGASSTSETDETDECISTPSPTRRLRRLQVVTPPTSDAEKDSGDFPERSTNYNASPTSMKRKRMEDLVARRKKRI